MTTSLPDILILTVDALRADHCSWHDSNQDTTPGLERFASTNLSFTNAWSVSSHTREAIPGLLTGRYPDECVDGGFSLDSDTIAKRLSALDYRTAAIHSNPYISRAYGFDADFDHFDDDLYFGQHKVIALAQRALDRLRNRHYASADEINERVMEWVSSSDTPFFLWAHYMDPHGPYCPPAEYQQQYRDDIISVKRAQMMYNRAIKDPQSITSAEKQEMCGLYDAEIKYTDDAITSLLSRLANEGLVEDTLIILSSDHGDAFGEHGYYGHPRRLNDSLTHVPLVVSTPEGDDQTVEGPTSTLDIVPTVLDAVGVDQDGLPGESLLQVSNNPDVFDDRVVYSQVRGMKDESHLRRFRATSAASSCVVEREITSGEFLEVGSAEDELCEQLRAFSDARLGETGTTDDGEDASTEVDRRLEALGYR